MPQITPRKPIPGLTIMVNPNDPPGGWDPNPPPIQAGITAEDMGPMPAVAAPGMFNPAADLHFPTPTDPRSADVEGGGMPDAGGVGPVPGLSWRWSGQPPSASELAKERTSWLGAHQGASPDVMAAADARQAQDQVDENIALHRSDLYAGKMRQFAMQTGAAATPEGQASERARRIQEGDVDLQMNGLRRAKQARAIGVEQAMTEPRAFMRPESTAARGMASREQLALLNDPAAVEAETRKATTQERLAELSIARTLAGSQMGAPMYGGDLMKFLTPGQGGAGVGAPAGMRGGPAGGPPAQGAPAGGGQPIPQAVLEKYAHENNMLFDQAVQQAAAEGLKVKMNDGTIR